jgi:hypothetical protein
MIVAFTDDVLTARSFFANAEDFRRCARGLDLVMCFLAGESVDDRHHSIHSGGQAYRDWDEVLVV